MKVLVTGGKGFIGGHVVKLLRERDCIVESYDLVDGRNVCSLETLGNVTYSFQPDVIVHLAGQVFLKPSLENPQRDAYTNIVGTINVLEVAMQNKCRVIYSSSGAVYGSNDRSGVSESHDCEPMSPYGLSKLTAERYCMLYNKLYGLDVVIFRFSSVYGTGRKKTSVNLILDRALRGEEIYITGSGKQTRDFTFVSDVAEAVFMAVENRVPTGIFNVGTGTSTSINDLVSLIGELTGKQFFIGHVDGIIGDPLKNDFNVDKIECYGFKAKVDLRSGLTILLKELDVDG